MTKSRIHSGVQVIFVNRYFYPDECATAQLLGDLAFYLAGRGHAVTVVASRQLYKDARADLPHLEDVSGVRIYRCWSTSFGRANLLGRALDYLSFYLGAWFCTGRLLCADNVLVAMTDPPLLGVALYPVVRLRGARLVNWLQDLYPELAAANGVMLATGLFGKGLRRLRNMNCRRAKINVVVGERMAGLLWSQGVPDEQLRIISNWAPKGLRPVVAAENRLREAWGLQDKFVIGYSGNLGRVHEFGTVIEAAKHLQSDRRFVFLFIGAGAQRQWLQEQAREEGLDNIVFRPYQPREHLSEALSVADVHLASMLPQFEGLVVPSKVYGIAAVGRPMIFIGSVGGEIAIALNRLGSGFTVRIGDGHGLVEAIRKLEADPELLYAMGQRGLAACRKNFTHTAVMPRWTALLDTVSANGA